MKTRTVLAVSALILAAALQVRADNVWNGNAADGLWTNGANWSLGVAPASGQGNIIFNNQSVTNRITVGPGDTSTVDGDMFGPEWGMDFVIDGGSVTQLSPGFVWAPIADSGDHCTIEIKNGASLAVKEMGLGDNWWFGGHPYVDMTISGSNTYVKADGWLWLGGHINLQSGTLEIGGNINFDASLAGYANIDITGGTLFLPAGTSIDVSNRIVTAMSNNQFTAYGGLGDVIFDYVWSNDEYYVTADAPPFIINRSPTGASTNNSPTLEAEIIDLSSTFVSAVLYLDGTPVATNASPSGTTNSISYMTSGLLAGAHTGKVIVTGTPASFTNSWTFEVSPFASITGSPEWSVTDSPLVQATVIEFNSIVDTSTNTMMYLDGAPVTPVIDRSANPTTTISYAASSLSHGAHTATVIVAGDPSGETTYEWTFDVVLESNIVTTLLHHWDFEENGGTTVADSVGGLDGTIAGTNYQWVAGGLALLGGETSGDWNPDSTVTNGRGSYVDLPNNFVGSLPNAVTFEVVYKADEPTGWWQRLLSFGTSAGGENISNGGAEHIFMTTYAGSGPRLDLNTGQLAFALDADGEAPAEDTLHLVWVYDADNTVSKLYFNGVVVDADAVATNSPLSDMLGLDNNNWFGRSQWDDDMLNGTLYDIRIYEGIMTSAEVVNRYNEVIGGGGPGYAPYITSIEVSGSDVNLSWTADSVGSYSILRKTALTDGSWGVVVSNLPPGNLTTNVTASGANEEFYSIKGE